jgi:hypothetical protein
MTKLAHSFSALKMYENCPQRYYRQRIKKDVKDVGSAASKEGERVHKALERRLGEGMALPKDMKQYEKLCAMLESKSGDMTVEEQLCLDYNLKPVSWFDKDAFFRVMTDVMIMKGDTAVYIDWKNGKRNIDYFQLDSTAANIFQHFPEINEVKTTLVWLKTMQMDSQTYTREDHYNKLWGDIYGRVALVEESLEKGEWPAKPSGLCGWCPAQTSCDSAKI